MGCTHTYAAPGGCTWGNGTGSAGLLAAHEVPHRIQRPRNHPAKTGHMRICTQVAPAPVHALAMVRHSTPNPQNHHEAKKHTAAAMVRHRTLGGVLSHARRRRQFWGALGCAAGGTVLVRIPVLGPTRWRDMHMARDSPSLRTAEELAGSVG